MGENDSHAEAAWAAVHQARRGITVAWVSVIVNALVVAIAVASPFVVDGLNQRAEARRYAEAKAMIIEHSHAMISADSQRGFSDLMRRGEAPWIIPNTEAQFRALQIMFNTLDDKLQRSRDRRSDRYAAFAFSSELEEASENLNDVASAFQSVMQWWRAFTDSGLAVDQELLDERRADAAEDIKTEWAEVYLQYELNIDEAGEPLPGRVIPGDCDKEEHMARCEEIKALLKLD